MPHHAYYNEFDPKAAAWLRELIKRGLIPAGDVDERSIADVLPDDLAGYTQCHFFAGIGGWPLAARLAGWPDDRPLWSGSPPCQPWSAAGKQQGAADARHLWPDLFRLIRARRPAVFVGEQVAAAVGRNWFDGVRSDLESIGYAGRGVVVPACAVNAPHRRDRLWFVAANSIVGDGQRPRLEGHAGDGHDTPGRSLPGGPAAQAGGGGHWHNAEWLISEHDGKARRAEPSIPLLVDGLPSRAPLLRGYGNAVVPAVAAEILGAWREIYPED